MDQHRPGTPGPVRGEESGNVHDRSADDWLHFVLGVGMIGLGVALSRTFRGTRANRI